MKLNFNQFLYFRIDDQSPDSLHKALQRSSSLKTERDTPRKKRNLERRKTITPILSSCSSSSCDASPTKDISALNLSTYDSVFTSPAVLSRQLDDEKKESEKTFEKDNKTDFVNNGANKLDDNTEGVQSIEKEEADLAVYKFLGEEVSVKKGIVKKQTMGRFTVTTSVLTQLFFGTSIYKSMPQFLKV